MSSRTVPAGREIFFPVVNLLDLNVEGVQTEEELRQEVKGWMDEALANPSPPLFATVDGQPVEMKRLDSPSALFHFTLLNRNYITENFGLKSGRYVGVTDGVYVTPADRGRVPDRPSTSGSSRRLEPPQPRVRLLSG